MYSSSATAWAVHELGLADVNDERLTKRGVKLAADLLAHPQSSIPRACQNWAATKAAYRFLANEKITSKGMLYAHQYQLRQRARDERTVLVAQDTMTLNLSSKQIAGIGSIGNGGHDGTMSGLHVHSGLALSVTGLPLGLTSQKIYTRSSETKTEGYRKTIKAKPITEKETYRWVEAVTAARYTLPDKHLVVIGDRESDIYEVFQEGHRLGVDLLVRTSQNRLLTEAQRSMKLFDVAEHGTIVADYQTEIPIDAHRTRLVSLTIRATIIHLPPPKSRDRSIDRPSLPLTVLNVAEEQPPEGVEPIHWLLTTSLPVTTSEEAIEKVQWYIYRWRIERFHYTLKTGAFNIEKLQFETVPRFAKAITLYSIVAVRVVQVLCYGRMYPLGEARTLFSDDEVHVLAWCENKPDTELTIDEATAAVAKLGGYLARSRDGPPGIKVLWQGFMALHYMVEGMLIKKSKDVGKE